MHKTHLFFDLDNTLTRSRSPITQHMRERLSLLAQKKDVIVISGQTMESILTQTGHVLPMYTMGQSGNRTAYIAANGEVTELWHDTLSKEERADILAHIHSLPTPENVPDTEDLVEDRGSQISYSLYGHHAPIEKKEVIDPQQEIRAALLAAHPLHSGTVEVKIAGTTCLDYVKKGRHKGHNIERLLKEKKWSREDCVYFGDALFPGGNDETVLGVLETIAVLNPEDTYRKLERFV